MPEISDHNLAKTYSSVLDVKDLSVTFPNGFQAVKDISFNIKEGELLALVGESGSGKSLTALSIMGLEPTNASISGEINFKGAKLDLNLQKSLRGLEIALIPQDPHSSLNPVYSIGNQLLEAVQVHNTKRKPRLSNAQMKELCIKHLVHVGIPDAPRVFNSYPHELSGGMKQRVMIAMAIINEPALLIADEPTTALDVTVQAVVLRLLKSLKKTILFITHDLAVVAEIADRVLVMKEGVIVEEAQVAELFENPQKQYTKDLLAAIPGI